MPLPPLTVDTFRNLANKSRLPDRDLAVSGADGARTVRLGNIVFTTSKAVNVATMCAFKEALEAEYGVFGTQASVGAVREALANDITRLLGIPAQELSLVRGEYSDGHPKLMLSAKFAEGYKDLEAGFLKDGHAVAPPGYDPIEPLGRYKALFLALADRDAVGTHGQNKGLVNGRFFAIDPGHSLEGNGKDLEIRDDLSFTDRKPNRLDKRFANYSVFDDDTRFAKFQGVLKLRELMRSGPARSASRSAPGSTGRSAPGAPRRRARARNPPTPRRPPTDRGTARLRRERPVF